ncbi:hypothetical protein STEG23_020125, partial [Scotinomys teguina]
MASNESYLLRSHLLESSYENGDSITSKYALKETTLVIMIILESGANGETVVCLMNDDIWCSFPSNTLAFTSVDSGNSESYSIVIHMEKLRLSSSQCYHMTRVETYRKVKTGANAVVAVNIDSEAEF